MTIDQRVNTIKIWYRNRFLWLPKKINGKIYWLRRVVQKIEKQQTETMYVIAYMDTIIGYYLTEEDAFLDNI